MGVHKERRPVLSTENQVLGTGRVKAPKFELVLSADLGTNTGLIDYEVPGISTSVGELTIEVTGSGVALYHLHKGDYRAVISAFVHVGANTTAPDLSPSGGGVAGSTAFASNTGVATGAGDRLTITSNKNLYEYTYAAVRIKPENATDTARSYMYEIQSIGDVVQDTYEIWARAL